jgi:hypothetical protein
VSADEVTPPRRRLRLTLTLDAHTVGEAADELRIIAYDLQAEGNDERDVMSSAGYHFTLTVREPDMTRERYEAELSEWAEGRRAARRGGSS